MQAAQAALAANALLSDPFPDEYRALPLLPPPDNPAYLAPPVVRATLASQRAAEKGLAAAVAAEAAQKAAQEADALAWTAQLASSDAAVAEKAAADLNYVDSVTRSVNRLLELAQAPIPDFARPPELRRASDLINETRQLGEHIRGDARRVKTVLKEFGEKLDSNTLRDLGRLGDFLKKTQVGVQESHAAAVHEQEMLVQQLPRDEDVPLLPPELERPADMQAGAPGSLVRRRGAEPWWPERLPPPEMPEHQLLLKPKARPARLPRQPDFAVFL